MVRVRGIKILWDPPCLFRFLGNRSGNVALAFGLLTPVLCISAGIAIDFQARLAQKAALQEAADTLSLRGARELLLDSATKSSVENLLTATAPKQFGNLGDFEMTPAVDTATDEVSVTIAQPSRKSFFLSQFIPHEDPIIVSALAVAKGVTNVCVIALEDAASDAIHASLSATLDAAKCAILSNSKSPSGVDVTGFAKLTAALICSAGGAAGGVLNYNPMPILDCPQYEDPLEERTPPDTAGCDYVDTFLSPSKNGSVSTAGGGRVSSTLNSGGSIAVDLIDGATSGTLAGYTRADLSPGVYCGGIKAAGAVDVHFEPGVYVIKDGPLVFDAEARLYGVNVGFYFTGNGAIFDFRQNSIVHLTAPKSGLMSGLLLWEDANAPVGRVHKISSANARELLGTIYLPNGTLSIDTMRPVADASAYTAIVAKKLGMSGQPQLVLNTDYKATDIPTPSGIGPTGGAVYLRQ